MSAAAPPIWTGIIALVFSLMRSSIGSAFVINDYGLESMNAGLLLQEFSCSGYKVCKDQAPVIKFRWKSGYNFRNKHNFVK